MRVFAIKEKGIDEKSLLGYLIYYEKAKAFYIELPETANVWNTPLIISSFVKRGEYSLNSYWSKRWIQQRIIPSERQNIGQILKHHKLSSYDEFSLLWFSKGRCEQDSYYLTEVKKEAFPSFLNKRWKTKVVDVVPLSNKKLLTIFRNEIVKILDMKKIINKYMLCMPYINREELFNQVELQPDGYGIQWNPQATIMYYELYRMGKTLPLTKDDLRILLEKRLITTAQTCKLLNCTKQNIDYLVANKKLNPIQVDSKHKLFLKNEVLQRKTKN